jgi:hypothetical protein
MKSKILIFLLLSASCLGSSESINNSIEANELFEKYLLTFKKRGLPFAMERKKVFELLSNVEDFPNVSTHYDLFIPDEIKKDNLDGKIRSYYALPEFNGFVFIILLQEQINEYEATVINSYLVSYEKDGRIIDFTKLLSVETDVEETFFEIKSDYSITRKSYQFQINSSPEMMGYFRLVETILGFEVNQDGFFKETRRIQQLGYFEGDWTGYKIIKPIEND